MKYSGTECDLGIKAIPTYYKGIRFRSRLEATWATFFDLLMWEWDYEPFDLPGWTPDFIIQGDTVVLVEAKPIYAMPEDVAEVMRCAVGGTAYANAELLIVGAKPWIDDDSDRAILGWVGSIELERHEFDRAIMGIWSGETPSKTPNRKVGFCSELGSFQDRITGLYDGGCYGCGNLSPDFVLELWAQAKNKTQYAR